jgi:hypothetical protein
MLRKLDTAALHQQFRDAEPFPSICIDDFLEPELAREIARSYPDHEHAEKLGHSFNAVNERRKVQITDRSLFPDPVKRLSDYFSTPEFIAVLSEITGIPNLLWDDTFAGGGMHQTAAHGRLDVHVDFNRLQHNGWYRRVNLLLYLNERWDEAWGGQLELWDRDVKRRYQSVVPLINRCVIFETSDISYHGVAALTCPPDVVRRSFALYYYTKEPPAQVLHGDHSTIFRARPNERLKRYVLMPAERLQRVVLKTAVRLKREAGRTLRRRPTE